MYVERNKATMEILHYRSINFMIRHIQGSVSTASWESPWAGGVKSKRESGRHTKFPFFSSFCVGICVSAASISTPSRNKSNLLILQISAFKYLVPCCLRPGIYLFLNLHNVALIQAARCVLDVHAYAMHNATGEFH